ncbi:hypothetical protein Q5P01_002242 [Channa striata]|uniref:Ig-like domain-containing protein n=1 Tax=Channa striata TaxID=64152 RepID=A0AA88NR04_CHASR|nr:hypothetical protein Q5P01_002242 [Channa striata]
MASPKLASYLTCLFFCKIAQMNDLSFSLQQEKKIISAHVGETITLQCFYDSGLVARYYWYKQTLGQKPRIISSFYVYEKNGTFYDECKNNPRFTLDTEIGKNHLIIRDLQFSDSATYFCASSFSITFKFGEGTVVNVKGSGLNVPALVHQSVSGTIQPGGSVTLNCTVHTGTCDGERSVYWFKDAEEFLPSVTYIHGDSNGQCKRTNHSQKHICAYNLLMKSLNRSHTGTYHCAVASCGHILFGNGTKLDLHDENSHLLYFLIGTLVFTSILSVLLSMLVNSFVCTESQAGFSAPSTTKAEVYRNEDNSHYVKSLKDERDNTCSECVYFSQASLKEPKFDTVGGSEHVTMFPEEDIQSPQTVQSKTALSVKRGERFKTLFTQVSYLNTMASPKLASFLTCLFFCKIAQMNDLSFSLQQEKKFISAHFGENITLQCFYDSGVVARYYWYKQTLGQKPRIISSFYVYDKNGTFYEECKNNPRFTLDTEIGKNHLIIRDLRFSDSATYFCASSFSITFKFGEGTVVSVKGSGLNVPALVHQSVSGTIQPGGSVTLNCTVHTGTCDGKRSIYWFKDAEEFLPSVIYTHGDSNGHCKRTNNSQKHICAYNLLMKSLNRSHTGTYHCAVASCGHILFGNGTTLNFSVYNTKKKTRCQCTESDAALSAPSTTNAKGFQNAENVHYGTVVNTCQRTKSGSGQTTCVYSLMRNISSEDAGTYFCAVTSYGDILFGKGTRINIHMDSAFIRLSPTVIALMLSNIVLGLVTIILVWTHCKSRRKDCTDAGESSDGNQISYTAVCSP